MKTRWTRCLKCKSVVKVLFPKSTTPNIRANGCGLCDKPEK